MEKRIDELEGLRTAINAKLSGVVNTFNDDKQKFKDVTEFEFAQHKLVLHEVVEGARHLPQKSMIPKNFTDKAGGSWQEEVADYVDAMTPGVKKVPAEIDQETDVIVISGDTRGRRSTWRSTPTFGGCCGGSLRESQRMS